jgi:hypothetical protein
MPRELNTQAEIRAYLEGVYCPPGAGRKGGSSRSLKSRSPRGGTSNGPRLMRESVGENAGSAAR